MVRLRVLQEGCFLPDTLILVAAKSVEPAEEKSAQTFDASAEENLETRMDLIAGAMVLVAGYIGLHVLEQASLRRRMAQADAQTEENADQGSPELLWIPLGPHRWTLHRGNGGNILGLHDLYTSGLQLLEKRL